MTRSSTRAGMVRLIDFQPEVRGHQEWDYRYRQLDLATEQSLRRENIEYLMFLETSMAAVGLDDKAHRASVRVVELGCGSAPLAAHLRDLGYAAEASDYSKVVVERVQAEFGIPGFAADCRDIVEVADATFDAVVLAGTVYEHGPDTPNEIYREVTRILRPGGVFIHFLNTYRSIPNDIIRIIHNASFFLSPPKVLRIFGRNLFRILINVLLRVPLGRARLPLMRKRVHHWLLDPEDVRNRLETCGLEVGMLSYMQIEDALCRLLPFLKADRHTYREDAAYKQRATMLAPLGQCLSEHARASSAKMWGRSMGICAVKPISHSPTQTPMISTKDEMSS